jgi:hypothetical protein
MFFYSVNPARHESGGPARSASQREAGGSAGSSDYRERARETQLCDQIQKWRYHDMSDITLSLSQPISMHATLV